MSARSWILTALLFLLLWIEFSSGERKEPAVENGKQIVRCIVRGRLTGISYVNYVCQRGGGGWVPVP